jgi:hypothetical protein
MPDNISLRSFEVNSWQLRRFSFDLRCRFILMCLLQRTTNNVSKKQVTSTSKSQRSLKSIQEINYAVTYAIYIPGVPLFERLQCNYPFCYIYFLPRKPGSSGSIVYGYGLDDRVIEVRSPAEAKGFFL